jgi:hypothetical protein
MCPICKKETSHTIAQSEQFSDWIECQCLICKHVGYARPNDAFIKRLINKKRHEGE